MLAAAPYFRPSLAESMSEEELKAIVKERYQKIGGNLPFLFMRDERKYENYCTQLQSVPELELEHHDLVFMLKTSTQLQDYPTPSRVNASHKVLHNQVDFKFEGVRVDFNSPWIATEIVKGRS